MAAELALAQEFAELSRQLLHEMNEQLTLDRVVTLAVETVESADFCSISVRTGRQVKTPAITDSLVRWVDEMQYHLGEGPCLDTLWASDACLVADLRTETRWPQWAQLVAERDIRSLLSVRIQGPEDEPLASLNLYARQPQAFDDTDLTIATIYARHAGVAVYGARQRANLETAIQSRQLIGAAQGILMQRFGLNLDQAFELLRRYSQTNNVKLKKLAENLVCSGSIPASVSTNPDTAGDAEILREHFGLPPKP